jgi:HK97 family phage prohead protease
MDTIETRVASISWPEQDMELRADEGSDGFRFSGYAAVFDTPSDPLPFRETIAPGAFAKSLAARRDIKMFLNHNWDIVLASRKAKTMTLREDDRGLFTQADLPDNEWGRPVRDGIVRGDISSMSFGFQIERQEPPEPGPTEDRTITEARLFEVSPVTSFPAYPATSASVRHLAEMVEVEDTELDAAFRALTADDGMLTDEQRELLQKLIDARTPAPLTTPHRDALAARLAALTS